MCWPKGLSILIQSVCRIDAFLEQQLLLSTMAVLCFYPAAGYLYSPRNRMTAAVVMCDIAVVADVLLLIQGEPWTLERNLILLILSLSVRTMLHFYRHAPVDANLSFQRFWWRRPALVQAIMNTWLFLATVALIVLPFPRLRDYFLHMVQYEPFFAILVLGTPSVFVFVSTMALRLSHAMALWKRLSFAISMVKPLWCIDVWAWRWRCGKHLCSCLTAVDHNDCDGVDLPLCLPAPCLRVWG